MANKVSLLTDPSGNYSGGYVSNIYKCSANNSSNNNSQRGAIQVDLTKGYVELWIRLTSDAPWFLARRYDESIVEEILLPAELYVYVSNAARAWVAELQ